MRYTFGRQISAALQRRPFMFACVSATVKTTTADLLVQTTVERREEIDVRRLAAFTIFGGLWMGAGQYMLYCKLFEALLPAKTAAAGVGKMVLDQFVHVPFVWFPMFYTVGTHPYVAHYTLAAAHNGVYVDAWVQGAWSRGEGADYVMTKYTNEVVPSLKANWSIWIPASFVGFRFVPTHFRIPCALSMWPRCLLAPRRVGVLRPRVLLLQLRICSVYALDLDLLIDAGPF